MTSPRKFGLLQCERCGCWALPQSLERDTSDPVGLEVLRCKSKPCCDDALTKREEANGAAQAP